jgi:hypothetical protein
MKIFSMMALVILTSCSQFSKKPETQIVEVKFSETDIQECRDYQKTVLDRAYTEVKGSPTSEIYFTKDPKLAREVIGKFDIKFGLTKTKADLVQNILHQCDNKRIKEFDDKYKMLGKCSLMFSELNYFQSLAVALKKYPWPTDLKLEGKKVSLDYVKYFSEGNFPLLNRLVALSVLDELSANEIVNKDLHDEIKVVMQESRTYVEGLRLKLNKDPGLSCDSMGIIRDELAYSDLVAKKMISFLARI